MDIENNNRKPQQDIPTEVITHYIVKDYRRMYLAYNEMKERAEKAEAKILDMKEKHARQLSKQEKEIEQLKRDIDEQSKETIKELKEKLEDTRQQNVVLARAVISQNCNEDGKVLFQGMVPADAKKLEEKIGIQLGDAQLKLNAVNEDLAFFKELIENNDIPDVADYTIKSFLTRVPSFFSKLDSATQRIENFYKLVVGIPVI